MEEMALNWFAKVSPLGEKNINYTFLKLLEQVCVLFIQPLTFYHSVKSYYPVLAQLDPVMQETHEGRLVLEHHRPHGPAPGCSAQPAQDFSSYTSIWWKMADMDSGSQPT